MGDFGCDLQRQYLFKVGDRTVYLEIYGEEKENGHKPMLRVSEITPEQRDDLKADGVKVRTLKKEFTATIPRLYENE